MNLMGRKRVHAVLLAALMALAGAILGGTCTTTSISSDSGFSDNPLDNPILDIPSG